jgi:hypothetical protein
MKHATTLAITAMLANLLACELAHAELVPVTWDPSGHFAHQTKVPPGKFVEVCEKLPQGSKVRWSYKSAAPMDFNIHYHEGKDVKFPAKQNASAAAEGVLDAATEQDFCWMWTNRSKAAAALQLTLRRE